MGKATSGVFVSRIFEDGMLLMDHPESAGYSLMYPVERWAELNLQWARVPAECRLKACTAFFRGCGCECRWQPTSKGLPSSPLLKNISQKDIPSESSQANAPKRKFPSESFRARAPKQKLPSERSQTKDLKRENPNESSQTKVRKRKIPSERS